MCKNDISLQVLVCHLNRRSLQTKQPTGLAGGVRAQEHILCEARMQSNAAGTSPLVNNLQQVQAAVGLGAPARADAGLARRGCERHATWGLQQSPEPTSYHLWLLFASST